MTQDFNPCAMRKIYEPNASIPNYLISGLMINFKEWYLRIKAHSFRFLSFVFLGLLLLLFFNWVGILYFLCLCSLLVLDFAFMVLSYGKMALKHRSQYPEGLILEVDDEGFRKSTKTGFQWQKIPWDSIRLAFDNGIAKNIALYQKDTEEYHLFFAQKMNDADYLELRKIIGEKINYVF